MLDLRPNCEWCDKDLPPDAADAMICSYECTYCAHCVETVLHNVCATCGGGLVPRPVRPRMSYRTNKSLGLGHHPASSRRIHSQWSPDEVASQAAALRHIPPAER